MCFWCFGIFLTNIPFIQIRMNHEPTKKMPFEKVLFCDAVIEMAGLKSPYSSPCWCNHLQTNKYMNIFILLWHLAQNCTAITQYAIFYTNFGRKVRINVLSMALWQFCSNYWLLIRMSETSPTENDLLLAPRKGRWISRHVLAIWTWPCWSQITLVWKVHSVNFSYVVNGSTKLWSDIVSLWNLIYSIWKTYLTSVVRKSWIVISLSGHKGVDQDAPGWAVSLTNSFFSLKNDQSGTLSIHLRGTSFTVDFNVGTLKSFEFFCKFTNRHHLSFLCM